MKNKNLLSIFCLSLMVILLPSCVKQSETSKEKKKEEIFDLKPFEKKLLEEEKKIEELKTEEKEKEEALAAKKQAEKEEKKISPKQQDGEIDFVVENVTGKTIYVVCFSYIKKRHFYRWRWDKSPVYKLEDGQTITIDVDYIPDEQNRKNIYGYLAVFENKEDAKNSIYELVQDKDKIDLDKIYNLKNHKVSIGIEKYGFKGELLDFDFVPLKNGTDKYPELDFVVENRTGKPIILTCFVYQIKEDMPVWRYDKTPLTELEPYEYGLIDVDTISKSYDRVYMRGYLAIFDKDEQEKAQSSTYELLKPTNKVALGRIAALKNKKIVLEVEKYGEIGDKVDYTVKPLQRIDFKKALGLK